jgi:hypothetical protein
MRSDLPTLLPPPNSRSLRTEPITTTASGLLSAARSQPEPNWNGTSNIGKKSLKAMRTASRDGRMSGSGG